MSDITLLETSYEVANKVGGIYTVLVSKMSYALETAKEYYAIGPYIEASAMKQFREEKAPKPLQQAFDDVAASHGIRCRYGTWMIEKRPKCILIDPGAQKANADAIKYELWEKHGIDSWGTDAWFNDPVVWSKCAGVLIEAMSRKGAFKHQPVAHFHEWLTGAGLLHAKSSGAGVRTVFTTHSTVLGRSVAETGKEDLYDMIKKGRSGKGTSPDKKAYDYKVQAKHLMEKACAKNCDVFTTVSQTMATECEYVLGRKPDIILPNGLDMDKFPSYENVLKMHSTYNEEMKDFILGYFLPYYEIEVEDAMVCFLSGRYEFRNKGIDIFIDALGRLNERLRKERSRKVVVAFIWVPAHTTGKKPTVVENLEVFENVEKVIEDEKERIERKIIKSFIRGETPQNEKVFDTEFLRKLKGLGERLKRMGGRTPPITPFVLPGENSITRALAVRGLMNRKHDPVKVIYYPAYLTEDDGLLEMKYYNAMVACDMGIFPSYYESWGYTPLEAAALGMHSVTTDLSGYGMFIKPHLSRGEKSITVLKRDGATDSQAAAELEKLMHDICKMPPEEAAKSRARAKELSMFADWKELYKNYARAYEMSMKCV